jgi:photosystem II stability/assembly factor-like uncharacterized protein
VAASLYGCSICAVILKTTDGGLSWEANQIKKADPLSLVFFVDPGIGYAVGENGSILKATSR